MSITKPQGRIEIGYAMVGGQRVPVVISIEWDRFLSLMTKELNRGLAGFTGAQGQAGAAVAMMDSGDSGGVEFIPIKGEKGDKGDPGPALFLMDDPVETEIFWKV